MLNHYWISFVAEKSAIEPLPHLDEMKDILDIKGVESWDFHALIVAAVVLLALVIVPLYLWLIFLWRKNKHTKAPRPLSPLEQVYKSLRDLEQKIPSSEAETQQFYFALSYVFRRYLEDRYSVSAIEATSEELIEMMKSHPIWEQINQKQFLHLSQISDMAKFAQFQPEQSEYLKSIASCRVLVDELESYFFEALRKNNKTKLGGQG